MPAIVAVCGARKKASVGASDEGTAARRPRLTWQVERKPKMSAEGAMTAIIFARDGARPERTPIWIPSEPKLATASSRGPSRQCSRTTEQVQIKRKTHSRRGRRSQLGSRVPSCSRGQSSRAGGRRQTRSAKRETKRRQRGVRGQGREKERTPNSLRPRSEPTVRRSCFGTPMSHESG